MSEPGDESRNVRLPARAEASRTLTCFVAPSPAADLADPSLLPLGPGSTPNPDGRAPAPA